MMTSAESYSWDTLPVFDEDNDDDIVCYESTAAQSNDYDQWLKRYYEIVKTNPRFHKYEKIVLDILEKAKEEMDDRLYEEESLFSVDSYRALTEYDYTFGKRHHGRIVTVSCTSSILYEFQIYCPCCASHKVTTDGSRNGDKKFVCKVCQRIFYYKQLVNNQYTERKAQLAMRLLESGCSQNFVAKLFEVSSSTVAKWYETLEPEIIDLCFDDSTAEVDFESTLTKPMTQKRLSFVVAFYFTVLSILVPKIMNDRYREVKNIINQLMLMIGQTMPNINRNNIFAFFYDLAMLALKQPRIQVTANELIEKLDSTHFWTLYPQKKFRVALLRIQVTANELIKSSTALIFGHFIFRRSLGLHY